MLPLVNPDNVVVAFVMKVYDVLWEMAMGSDKVTGSVWKVPLF